MNLFIEDDFGIFMHEIDKKRMIETFMKVIDHISNKEYQKKAWIRGEGVGFDEAVNLFSDLGDPILENYKDYGITEAQHHLLILFKNEFKAFYDEQDLAQEFIDTPEWARIMKRAKEVLKVFNKS